MKLKKTIIILITVMLLLNPTNAYQKGDLVYENTVIIEANSYSVQNITLNSDFDISEGNQGFDLFIESNNSLDLIIVVEYNESMPVHEEYQDYGTELEHINGSLIVFEFLDNHNPINNEFQYISSGNTTNEDPYKFYMILYNNGSDTNEYTLNLIYLDIIGNVIANTNFNFLWFILAFSMIVVIKKISKLNIYN